jgi:N6-adenosine-specific RNA methylase IME4
MDNHPAADAFPMMDNNRYKELLEDIREHGQREAITICDGMILDGRNRYKACLELGIEPITRVFNDDPWSYVWSLNGQRRDLVGEQRYLIWKFCYEQSEAFQIKKKHIQEEANRKRSEAAKEQPRIKTETGKTVFDGQVVQQSVTPPVKEHKATKAKASASKTNAGAVSRGDKLANDRPDLAKKVRLGEMKPAAAHRQMKKDEVSKKIEDLPKGQYRVLYADPPWKYNDAQAVKGEYGTGTGAAEGHYPIMKLSELKALNIKTISAENSVLFLWATSPLLEDALELCKAWGFKYKAQFIWDKVKHNMGHYNSVRHEILLICTRGSCLPDSNKLIDSVQVIERTKKHSQKPEEFRNIIDEMYSLGPRIELFKIGDKPEGWETWGNEAI